ncbi:hypothetical protein ZEAMMB73_Zm00001d033106 [Zea mays]|uniref:Uncharacterized protein n=1 Tax=Zea mays TaxID=4577 RepID=A0A1D6KWB3_MAIZE|nr:hypothetical protein ZEAMMB73_Zm00001d033106 [Zea mays]
MAAAAPGPGPSPHQRPLRCFLLLVLLVSSPHYSSGARTSPDLAGGTLQYGARKLISIDNPVTPPPPAPVSGPPIGPGFVRPPQEV